MWLLADKACPAKLPAPYALWVCVSREKWRSSFRNRRRFRFRRRRSDAFGPRPKSALSVCHRPGADILQPQILVSGNQQQGCTVLAVETLAFNFQFSQRLLGMRRHTPLQDSEKG